MLPVIPKINVVHRATEQLGIDLTQMVEAVQQAIVKNLGPLWGVVVKLLISDPGEGSEVWIVDDADQAGVLGFHDQEVDGLARGFVCVRECHRLGYPVSVVLFHEVGEMAINPSGNLGALSPRGRFVAGEPFDPVQRSWYAGKGGVPLSNFVTPQWFGQPGESRYDFMGLCDQPWQIMSGGYIPVFENGQWSEIFGSRDAEAQHKKEDRRLHRTERIHRRSLPSGHTMTRTTSGADGIQVA